MKIAVIGPQNTGKSTFIKDFLSDNSKYSTPSKTYRDVVLEKGLGINQKTNETSQEAIASFLELSLKENTNPNIVFDRCLIDNYVYSYLAFKKGNISEEYIKKLKKRVIESLKYIDFYVFIPTSLSVGLVNDALRDTDVKFIDEVNDTFISVLFNLMMEYRINVYVLTGTRDERVSKLNKIINKELSW